MKTLTDRRARKGLHRWRGAARHVGWLLLTLLPPHHLFASRRLILRGMGVVIGTGVRVAGAPRIYGRGDLFIGAHTWIGPGCEFYTALNAPILIGANVDVGPGVLFVTGTHLIGGPLRRAGRGNCGPISIGAGTWVGTRAVVLGNAVVGDGCVVGAQSLVVGTVEPQTLAVGIPVRAVRVLPLDAREQ